MKADIKAEWRKRLIEDEIPQAVGVLGTTEGARCCLGVLCDIAVEHGVIAPPQLYQEGDILEYGYDTGVLPSRVMEWAGLETPTGHYFEDGRLSSLSGQNDNGVPFPEIAAIIGRKF